MSRHGRHGRHPHPPQADPRRPALRPAAPAEDAARRPVFPPAGLVTPAGFDEAPAGRAPRPAEPAPVRPASGFGVPGPDAALTMDAPTAGPADARGAVPRVEPVAQGPRPMAGEGDRGTTCTTAQLRRFIKSRPWIPMHELRRRFGIRVDDDDVTPIRVGEHTLFIGLPALEGRMMGELLGAGDVGYELSLDPSVPVVVGVYPMRPVPRA